MQVLSSKIVKAKKQHQCQLCCGKIEVGQKYNTQFNTQDGDAYMFKNHIHCQEIASKLKMYDECDYGLTDEIFQESIREEYKFLMDLHHTEIYNYAHFVYPNFQEQLKFVHDFHLNKVDYEQL